LPYLTLSITDTYIPGAVSRLVSAAILRHHMTSI